MWTLRVINKEEHTIFIARSEDVRMLLTRAFAMREHNKNLIITLRRNAK